MDGLIRIFADNLKMFRAQKKLTQEALAEKSDLSVRMIGEVEAAKRAPSFPSVEKLAKALGVQPYEFFLPAKGAEGFSKKRLIAGIKADIAKVLDKHFEQ
jgi:transcriptional regulator with XRE-family HTH domain